MHAERDGTNITGVIRAYGARSLETEPAWAALNDTGGASAAIDDDGNEAAESTDKDAFGRAMKMKAALDPFRGFA